MNEAEKIEKILRAIRGALLPLTERMVDEGQPRIRRPRAARGGLLRRRGGQQRPRREPYISRRDRYAAPLLRARGAPRAAGLHIRREPRAMPRCAPRPSRGPASARSGCSTATRAVKEGFDMPVDLMMYREIFGAEGPAHGKRILHAALPARRGGEIPRTPSARRADRRNRRRLLRDAREGFRVSRNVAGRRGLNQFP